MGLAGTAGPRRHPIRTGAARARGRSQGPEGPPKTGSSLRKSREKLLSRVATPASLLRGGQAARAGLPGAGPGGGGVPGAALLRQAGPRARSPALSSPPAPPGRVWARSSSATASCAWCGGSLSGW